MSLYHLNERRNAQTRLAWQGFAEHRQHVTRLIESANTACDQTLCVLGAGNCNDLDLDRLLQRFQGITLVDIDPGAVKRGVESQLPPHLWSRTEIVALDVTGAFDLLDSWRGNGNLLGEAGVSQLMRAFAQRPAVEVLNQRFNVVLSSCVLSQLVDSLVAHFGKTPRHFVPLVQALRRQHLETLFDLTLPRGAVVLIFDYVSSDTCPNLPHVASDQIPSLSMELVASGNFFTGLRPDLVTRDFHELGSAAAQLHQAQPEFAAAGSWRWQLGERFYIVQGVTCRLK